MLKQRATEQRLLQNAVVAEDFYYEALDAYRDGNAPVAARCAHKAIGLNPAHAAALALLGSVHWEARNYTGALHYFRQARKYNPDAPVLVFNCGLANGKLDRPADALQDFERFLELSGRKGDANWREMRSDARTLVENYRRIAKEREAAPVPSTAPPSPSPLAEPPAASPPPAPPPPPTAVRRPQVSFLSVADPEFPTVAAGTLADYLLRDRLRMLRLAQSFEDLICLPSLNGVDTYVYQHETVRRVLRQFKGRALLADEVGLGKTIEACLILKEYWMRGMVRRALVLTPPSLTAQWKDELVEKFGLTPAIPEGVEFRRNPERFWAEEPLVISSIAMARLEAHAAAIAGAAWDMVIVDEAHCLKNRNSANWKLVNSLQKKFLLMLTATPVENHLLDLYNLITVLKPGLLATEEEFKKLFIAPGKPKSPRNAARLHEVLKEVMIRNTRSVADVHLPHRVATSIVVPPTAAEAELYESVSAFVQRQRRAGNGSSLGCEWLQRQAGSSPYAVGLAAGRMLSDAGGKDGGRDALERIQEMAGSIASSGKGRRLVEMLGSHAGKAVVFTDFIATLEYLERICLQHGIRYASFRGDMARAGKDAAIARFRDEVPVLLSTGAGGEGRNLQFADTVLNFDLPWSPMRLEQRVGRVHRIGQTNDVFVFNFCQQGSLEEQILRVLHDKVNMFELVVGEMDAILGSADDSQDFAGLVLDLWLAHDEAREREKAFDELAARLLAARQRHLETKRLDDSLFQQELEV